MAALSPEQEAALGAAGATPALLAALREPALLATPQMVEAYQARLLQKARESSEEVEASDRAQVVSPLVPQSGGTSAPVFPEDRSNLPATFHFPKTFAGTPYFQTKEGRIEAGMASLAKLDANSQVYLLTVRHLLGPAGGFRRQVTAEEIPGFVQSIELDGLFGGLFRYQVRGFAIASSPDRNSPLNDLAIFKVLNGAEAQTAHLAAKVPPIGAPVWIVAHVVGGIPKGQKIHRATVVENRGAWLVAAYADTGIVANGSSGAPVLDAEGNIVAINAAGGRRNGRELSFSIPAPLVAAVIRQARTQGSDAP